MYYLLFIFLFLLSHTALSMKRTSQELKKQLCISIPTIAHNSDDSAEESPTSNRLNRSSGSMRSPLSGSPLRSPGSPLLRRAFTPRSPTSPKQDDDKNKNNKRIVTSSHRFVKKEEPNEPKQISIKEESQEPKRVITDEMIYDYFGPNFFNEEML